MTSNWPLRSRLHASMDFLLTLVASARDRLKNFLPYFQEVANRKRFLGRAVRNAAVPAKRIHALPFDCSHLFCPECRCSIPTHDVLLALRPNGFVQWFWAEDQNGNRFLIRETDYNPSAMRMSLPIPMAPTQDQKGQVAWRELPVASEFTPQIDVQ